MRGVHRARSKAAAPEGTWLAFLAVAIQVLLPFLVAYEITLAGTPAYAASKTTTICSASGSTTSPASRSTDHTAHHGLADGCPICMALAAGQAFTAAAAVALALPQVKAVVLRVTVHASRVSTLAAASYNPRAPPFIA